MAEGFDALERHALRRHRLATLGIVGMVTVCGAACGTAVVMWLNGGKEAALARARISIHYRERGSRHS